MRMSNILRIFKDDLRHLFANVVSCIVTIGLVILPSIFAWYNLLACWDVFDNTGNLTVAVANEDEGYASDLIPIKVNIGDMVVSELRGNHEIGWRFTDKDDAIDGAASGKYYAAVVIPQEFSRDMLRFYVDDSQHAQITYYDNEKINALSPKITAMGADAISEKVNTAFAQSVSEVMLSVAKSVSRYADDIDLNGQISVLANHIDAMASDIERVSDVVGMYSGTISSAQHMLDDGSELIRQTENEASSLMSTAQTSLNELSSLAEKVASMQNSLENALEKAQNGFDDLESYISESDISMLLPDEARQQIKQAVDQGEAKIAALREDYNKTIKPDLDRLAADGQGLEGDVSRALEYLQSAQGSVSSAVNAAHDVLGDALDQISAATGKLQSSAETLRNLAHGISDALVAADPDALQALLGSDAQALSQALSAPVGIHQTAVFPSENFGSALAPFYTTLAMYIGSLLIIVAIKPAASKRTIAKLKDVKPHQLLLGHFGCMACVSLAQTTLICAGNLLFLQVQAVHPWLVLLAMWLAGLVFTFLIYTLVAAFANLGKAIAIVLLVMQMTGCGGTYPLELLPDFVSMVSPLLPATHVVDALRAAMFGMYHGDYLIQMGETALFIVPAAIIGLVLRKPLARFMQWYVAKVESTQIIG